MQDAKLVLNGYIIQKAKDSYYRGIDGDNWFLNYCSDNIYFAKVHEHTIGNSMDNPERVECTADVAYSGGSFYPCVLNDVVSGRIPEFQTVRLNEKGDCVIYQLTEVTL